MKEITIDNNKIDGALAAILRANQVKAVFIRKLTAARQNHRLAVDIMEKKRRYENKHNL